jgi:hypothetical protein
MAASVPLVFCNEIGTKKFLASRPGAIHLSGGGISRVAPSGLPGEDRHGIK